MNKINWITCIFVSLIVLYIGSLEWRTKNNISFEFRNQKEKTKRYNIFDEKRSISLMISLVFTMSFLFRLWKFGIIPGGLNPDSAMATIDAKSLMQYGTDRLGMIYPIHFTAWGYSQMSVLMSYMMIPFFRIWGVSEITARLPSLILSMFGLFALFFLVKDICNEKFALLVLVIAAFNPWHFIQSRWALDANLLPHFLIIGLFFLNKGIQKEWSLYASMIFFGLSHYCYGISIYIVPVFLFIYCIYLMKTKRIIWRKVVVSCVIYLFISTPFYLTMIINTFNFSSIQTPFFTIPRFPETTRNKDILFFADNKWEQFKVNATALFYTLFFQKGGNGWSTIEGFGTSIICLIPFNFLGCYELGYLWKKEINHTKKAGYMMITLYSIIAFCSGFVTVQVNEWRINPFLYMQILLVAFGMHCVFRNSTRLFVGCIVVLITMEALFLFRYFDAYAAFWRSTSTYSTYFVKALEAVEDRSCETYYITDCTQYDGSRDVSEIETIYVHNLDASYIQGKTNLTNGQSKNLYEKQYQYVDIGELKLDSGKNAIYIINDFDEFLFSKKEYVIEKFGQYRVAIPKKYF